MLNLLVVLLVQKYCTKTLHALYMYVTYYIHDQCMYLVCKLQYMYYMLHQLPVLGAPL